MLSQNSTEFRFKRLHENFNDTKGRQPKGLKAGDPFDETKGFLKDFLAGGYYGSNGFFSTFGGRYIIISDLGVQSRHGCYLPDFSFFCRNIQSYCSQ